MNSAYLELTKRYPLIFKRGVAVDCGPGWKSILEVLCEALQRSSEAPGASQIEAVQIKEKFGALRVSTYPRTPESSQLLSFAEALSMHVCEVCGCPGTLHSDPPLRTRCEQHALSRAD